MARVSLELGDAGPPFTNCVGVQMCPFVGKDSSLHSCYYQGRGSVGSLGYTSEQRGPAEHITHTWAVRGVIPFSRGGK